MVHLFSQHSTWVRSPILGRWQTNKLDRTTSARWLRHRRMVNSSRNWGTRWLDRTSNATLIGVPHDKFRPRNQGWVRWSDDRQEASISTNRPESSRAYSGRRRMPPDCHQSTSRQGLLWANECRGKKLHSMPSSLSIVFILRRKTARSNEGRPLVRRVPLEARENTPYQSEICHFPPLPPSHWMVVSEGIRISAVFRRLTRAGESTLFPNVLWVSYLLFVEPISKWRFDSLYSLGLKVMFYIYVIIQAL
jgi:hypothetical protein